MTTKQELREHIELINENRRLLIKDLQENEKARSMHANLNRGVASELGLECGADWSNLPELVKALKAERDSLKEGQGLVKLKPLWRGADQLPPVDEEYLWSSINVLLVAPGSAIPVVAYYHFEDKCWYDYHTGNYVYVNEMSEWIPLPVKERF